MSLAPENPHRARETASMPSRTAWPWRILRGLRRRRARVRKANRRSLSIGKHDRPHAHGRARPARLPAIPSGVSHQECADSILAKSSPRSGGASLRTDQGQSAPAGRTTEFVTKQIQRCSRRGVGTVQRDRSDARRHGTGSRAARNNDPRPARRQTVTVLHGRRRRLSLVPPRWPANRIASAQERRTRQLRP